MRVKLPLIMLICSIPLLLYFSISPADRGLAVGAGAVFAVILSIFFLWYPLLVCPSCGRATACFDNYFEITNRLIGGLRRYTLCRRCGCVIDRLTGRETAMIPDTARTKLRRLAWGYLAIVCGVCLILPSLLVGGIVISMSVAGVARPDRARNVLVGCLVGTLSGVALIVAGWQWRKV